MCGINYTAPSQSVTSKDQRIRLGYTVSSRLQNATRRYLTDLWIGHLWWWQHEEARVIEKNLLEEYGTIVRWNGSLGVSFFHGGRVAVVFS